MVASSGEGRADSGQVVAIVDSHLHLDQTTGGRPLNEKLAPSVDGGEGQVVCSAQTKFGVVGRHGLGLRNTNGDRGQSMQCHGEPPPQPFPVEERTKC